MKERFKEKFGLIAVMSIGVAIVGFFGFNMHHSWWYSWALPTTTLNHQQGWELGAVVWTFCFLIYYFIRVNAEKPWQLKVVFVVLALECLLCYAVEKIVLEGYLGGAPIFHVLAVTAIGLSLAGLDVWLGMKRTALVADAPMLVGFGILLLFLWSHQSCAGEPIAGTLVPGAIAFQLIVSNFLFFIAEWGFLDKPLASAVDTVAAFPSPTPESRQQREV